MLIPRTTGSLSYAVVFREARAAALAFREVGPAGVPRPRLLDRVREAIRARHYSRRTEKTYVAWIRRYIFFHGKRHPAERLRSIKKEFKRLRASRLYILTEDVHPNNYIFPSIRETLARIRIRDEDFDRLLRAIRIR